MAGRIASGLVLAADVFDARGGDGRIDSAGYRHGWCGALGRIVDAAVVAAAGAAAALARRVRVAGDAAARVISAVAVAVAGVIINAAGGSCSRGTECCDGLPGLGGNPFKGLPGLGKKK